MALPSPASVWKFAKFAIKAGEMAIPAGFAYLSSQLSFEEEAEPILWKRIHCEFTRTTPAGTVEDKAQFKIDVVNITGGVIDNSWTTADYTACALPLNMFRGSTYAQFSSAYTWSGYRWYDMAFNPALDVTRPFADTGGPVRFDALTNPCTGSTGIPYQVSATVTQRTAWAKHWGRAYMPTPAATMFDATGRLTSSFRTTVANAWRLMVDDMADAGFLVVVPVGQINKVPWHGLLGVTDVVVDDVPDIVRRRRPKVAAARTIGV